MASNDSLIFPVGFDMESAIKNAEEQFKKKEKQLEKAFTANINLKISPKSIDNLEDVQKRLKELRLEPITPESRNAIRTLVAELSQLESILIKIDKLNAQRTKNATQAALANARTVTEEAKAEGTRAKNMQNYLQAQEKLTQEQIKSANLKATKRRQDSAAEDVALNRRLRAAQLEQQKTQDEIINEEKKRQAKIRTLKAEQDLANVKARGASSIKDQTVAFKEQSAVLGNLQTMMGAYVSLAGLKQLGERIRKVTQEFELQRVALTAILQDKEASDRIFGQIVELAVKSPYQIKEMIGFTKQLAAYRIQTEELFDTTKRLADVSAGLGVEMSRIILAYGQVSAAAVLRGQELRQFTEAGIPMVQLLADKFTQLNGEVVTTGEVFELISQRAVSFGMVKEIFKDMTDEGGIFYDMQKKQAETLHGVFSNLADAWDVAFNEIGQSQYGLMKGIGVALTDLGEHWRTLEAILSNVVVTMGVYKAALYIATRQTIALTAAKRYEIMFDSIQQAQLPKVIKSIAGVSVAKKIELGLTNSLIAAKGRLATTNNHLLRGYLKLKVAILSHPWIALAAAIAAVGYATYQWLTYESDVDRMHKKIAKGTNEFKSASDASAASLNILMSNLSKASKGSKEYAGIVGEINKRYSSFLPQQLKVSQSYDDIARAVSGVTKALNDKSRAEALTSAINEVESNYSETLVKAQEKAVESLSSKSLLGGMTFTKAEANEIWGKVISELRDNPALYKGSDELGKLMADNVREAFVIQGVAPEKLTDSFINAAMSGMSGFGKQVKAVSGMLNDIESDMKAAESTVASTFGQDRLDPFSKKVKEINDEFDKYRTHLSKTSMKEETFNTALIELEKEELQKLISVYKEYGQFKLGIDAKEQLDKLNGLGRGWRNIVDSMIDANNDMAKFRPTEDENSLFNYADSLISKYTEVRKQIKRLEGDKAKGGGLNVDDDGRLMKRLTSDMKNMEALAKRLRIDLTERDKTATPKKDPRISQLENEIKLVKEVHSRYKELSKFMSEADAKSEIEKTYGDVSLETLKFAFNEDELKAQYTKLISGLKSIGADKAVVQKFNVEYSDVDFGELKLTLEEQLKQMGNEIEKKQKANKFFEKLIGAGMDTEVATSITMSFYGFDANEVRDAMIQQLQTGLGDIELDLTPEGTIDFDSVQKKIEASNLPENLKSAYLDLNKAIRNADAETIERLFSNLSKYSEYEKRRSAIVAEANENRKAILSTATPSSERGQALVDAAKEEQKKLATLEFEIFKDSDLYINMFENLERVSTDSLRAITKQLDIFKKSQKDSLSPKQVKELTKSFEQVQNEMSRRNPFEALTNGLKNYNSQAKAAKIASKEILEINAELEIREQMLTKALEAQTAARNVNPASTEYDKQISDLRKIIDKLKEQLNIQTQITNKAKGTRDVMAEAAKKIGEQIGQFHSSFNAIGDTLSDLGVDMDSELGSVFKDYTDMLGGASQAATGFGKILQLDFSGIGDIFSGVGKYAQSAIGLFTGLNRRVARANKEIKKQAETLRVLNEEYRKLDKIMNRAMGTDWAKANIEQVKNLEAQTVATQKQLEAEKSKGKKKDKDKIKEYEQQLVELQEAVVDKQRELTEHMLGTTVGDAARDFASAWLDAYLSFENTTDAIKDRFKDMLNHLVVEAVLAKAIESRISKLFEDTDGIWTSTGDLNMNALNSILAQVSSLPEDLDKILTAIAGKLDLEGLRVDSESSLTGVSKAVGSLSEETALVLGAAANSLIYYSVGQYNEVLAIRELLDRWEASRGDIITDTEQTTGLGGLIQVQNMALDELRKHTVSLEDIQQSNREIQEFFVSLTSPIGTKGGTRQVNVGLN